MCLAIVAQAESRVQLEFVDHILVCFELFSRTREISALFCHSSKWHLWFSRRSWQMVDMFSRVRPHCPNKCRPPIYSLRLRSNGWWAFPNDPWFYNELRRLVANCRIFPLFRFDPESDQLLDLELRLDLWSTFRKIKQFYNEVASRNLILWKESINLRRWLYAKCSHKASRSRKVRIYSANVC
jgi:hypothetical protein